MTEIANQKQLSGKARERLFFLLVVVAVVAGVVAVASSAVQSHFHTNVTLCNLQQNIGAVVGQSQSTGQMAECGLNEFLFVMAEIIRILAVVVAAGCGLILVLVLLGVVAPDNVQLRGAKTNQSPASSATIGAPNQAAAAETEGEATVDTPETHALLAATEPQEIIQAIAQTPEAMRNDSWNRALAQAWSDLVVRSMVGSPTHDLLEIYAAGKGSRLVLTELLREPVWLASGAGRYIDAAQAAKGAGDERSMDVWVDSDGTVWYPFRPSLPDGGGLWVLNGRTPSPDPLMIVVPHGKSLRTRKQGLYLMRKVELVEGVTVISSKVADFAIAMILKSQYDSIPLNQD
jgi:hypothetical protein